MPRFTHSLRCATTIEPGLNSSFFALTIFAVHCHSHVIASILRPLARGASITFFLAFSMASRCGRPCRTPARAGVELASRMPFEGTDRSFRETYLPGGNREDFGHRRMAAKVTLGSYERRATSCLSSRDSSSIPQIRDDCLSALCSAAEHYCTHAAVIVVPPDNSPGGPADGSGVQRIYPQDRYPREAISRDSTTSRPSGRRVVAGEGVGQVIGWYVYRLNRRMEPLLA